MLTPICLESKAWRQPFKQNAADANVNSGIDEAPIRNFAEVIGEPRLDDASATAWYLAAAR